MRAKVARAALSKSTVYESAREMVLEPRCVLDAVSRRLRSPAERSRGDESRAPAVSCSAVSASPASVATIPSTLTKVV
jgi:hypothetical protein